jgi:hypothetical protein
MKTWILGMLALTAAAMLVPGPAAAIVGSNTHNFDDLSAFQAVGTHYLGFSYSSGAVALCVPNYNYFGYPPNTQPCVVYDNSGTTTISATDPLHWFIGVRGFCSTADPFANPNGISIVITDILGTSASATCKSAYGANAAFSNAGTGLPASTAKIHDTGNYFTYDTLVFSSLL